MEHLIMSDHSINTLVCELRAAGAAFVELPSGLYDLEDGLSVQVLACLPIPGIKVRPGRPLTPSDAFEPTIDEITASLPQLIEYDHALTTRYLLDCLNGESLALTDHLSGTLDL